MRGMFVKMKIFTLFEQMEAARRIKNSKLIICKLVKIKTIAESMKAHLIMENSHCDDGCWLVTVKPIK